MARRRIHDKEVIEIEYNGRTVVFREADDEWGCFELKLKARSLSALKAKINKIDGLARKISCPAIRVEKYGRHLGEPAQIVMLAKGSEWERMAYDEKPELLQGLHNRRVPTVWIMVAEGNQPATRTKVRLDELAPPTESVLASVREYERLGSEIKKLEAAKDSVLKAIPRLTIEDIAPKGVKEENLDG
jgi:hypothetical protein